MQENIETGRGSKLEHAEAAVKHRLGQVGRTLKKVDLRKQIIEFPFAAVGIAAAAGAIVGLVRPTPERGRISGALISTLGVIGFRLIRETAMRELGTYAKNYVLNRKDQNADLGGQGVEGGSVRYTPAL